MYRRETMCKMFKEGNPRTMHGYSKKTKDCKETKKWVSFPIHVYYYIRQQAVALSNNKQTE